jgi:hypothetical protein
MKLVKGEHVQVREANHVFFRAFSEELGFDALLLKDESLEESHANIDDNASTVRYSTHVVRRYGIEERRLALERSFRLALNKI